jgi:predicted DNA-binding antitoxin AbrB/MazE fold protein
LVGNHLADGTLEPGEVHSFRGLANFDAWVSAYNSGMPLQVDAVYENGVLRPLQPLDLREHERVLVSVVKAPAGGRSSLAVEYVEKMKRGLQDAEPAPGIEEVRRRLAKIPGSMAAEIVADRGDR